MHGRRGRWRVLVYNRPLVSLRPMFPTTPMFFLCRSFCLHPTEEVSMLDGRCE